MPVSGVNTNTSKCEHWSLVVILAWPRPHPQKKEKKSEKKEKKKAKESSDDSE